MVLGFLVSILAAAAAPADAPRSAPVSVSTVLSDIEASGDLSIDGEGRIYIADFGATLRSAGGETIWVLSSDGLLQPFAGGFAGGSGNAFGAEGELYQSDVSRGEVWRIDRAGNRTRIAANLANPVGVAPAPDGSVYVAQCGARRITQILPDGRTRSVAEGDPLLCPNGLTFGPDGMLYTVNFRGGGMIRVDPASGEMAVHATIPGGGAGHVASANGRFYVASFRGHAIFEVSPAGHVCRIAGTGAPGSRDGPGDAATFFRPNGVAVSADGDTLYTNTTIDIVPPEDGSLHRNALRRIEGLLRLPPCGTDGS